MNGHCSCESMGSVRGFQGRGATERVRVGRGRTENMGLNGPLTTVLNGQDVLARRQRCESAAGMARGNSSGIESLVGLYRMTAGIMKVCERRMLGRGALTDCRGLVLSDCSERGDEVGERK